MILQFVIAALLLLIVFAVFMVSPFIGQKSKKLINKERRNQLNHELYDIRIKEVEDDISQGVVVDKEAMVAELQYNLLDDIDENVQSKQNDAKRIWIPGVAFLVLASVALYWSIGAFKEVNDWQNALQRYPEIHKKLFEQPDSRPNEQELKDLMLGLRSHLADQPSDAQGWVLYSRLGRVFQDKELAIGAIEKALHYAPNNIEIQLEYIELITKIGDEYSQASAQSMLVGFLQQHPDNYDAWSMYAFIALQEENFVIAIDAWQQMLKLVDPNSEQAGMLNQSILYAKDQLALQIDPEESQIEEQVVVNQSNDSVAAIGPAYNVTVTITDNVTYTANSTLFIYAQPVNGPSMPIAAIKLPVSEFPVKVVLSDANAMMQGIKLSDHKQFIIKARISADGTVNRTDGQWFGASKIVEAGSTEQIDIEINEQS
ncbi:c-type cytochrome biogenesis protein CcmI [Psychromonas algicola]|uniref:c-type cytochrome biogenesis protein CcmI n=1 Tax=Psychromonas algicola TaxID=2555642 RepID=UPI001067B1AE|nr:c-type cytochrome biogenesis protein CcmI [Psychromonas sp. RZ5]TEW51626.1 c-type cytochrome biogenesis protein CcmI [Psychromonas sp. RZ5]